MCTNCSPKVATQKVDVFAEKLLGILNGGSLAVMTSIGHQTGLFDTMSTLEPASSQQIADAAGLNERYVREWLGAMTVGGIVKCSSNGAGLLYSLPAEHAACLTRAAAADNMGVFAQYIGLMGSIEGRIIDCFKKGGGVPYSEFERFHEVMAEDSGQSIVSSLTDALLPLVPGLMDNLQTGIDALDVGCGRGRADLLLAKTFPKSRFLGYDLCMEPIEWARGQVAEQGLNNVEFEVRNLTTFDEDAPAARFDLITAFDAIHDQARPDRVLAGISKALKPDGVFLMQDIAGSSDVTKNYDHPLGPFLYSVSCMHCMTVSLAQGGMGLGTMWGKEKALEMLEAAGFHNVQVKNIEHDVQNNYYVARKR